jgi:lipooligosaccharide transport system ATP-binding protein
MVTTTNASTIKATAAASTPALIQARGLSKRFGDLVAVDSIDFEVLRGECMGFLGPNGAGKTSTIRMICCASPVGGGELRVLGMDPATHAREIKARLGAVPQEDNLDTDLTVLENLLAYARYFDIKRPEAVERAWAALDTMALTDKAAAKIDALSGGMKRRLTVARALISRPELLVLDEPTTGLDPQARHLFWQRLRQLKREGLTMLLTTHYMEEAAQLCDRVIVMDHSQIIARGTPRDLVRELIGETVVEAHLDPALHDEGLRAIEARSHGYRIEEADDAVFIYADGADPAAFDLDAIRPYADEVTLRRASLEDVFLRLIGRRIVE